GGPLVLVLRTPRPGWNEQLPAHSLRSRRIGFAPGFGLGVCRTGLPHLEPGDPGPALVGVGLGPGNRGSGGGMVRATKGPTRLSGKLGSGTTLEVVPGSLGSGLGIACSRTIQSNRPASEL